MGISFKIENDSLILILESEQDEFYLDKLHDNENIKLKNCFSLNKDNWISHTYNDDTLNFSIGIVEGKYVHLDKNVFETQHEFYFDKEIKFKLELFLANRNISIISKIDNIIDQDIYVGGDNTKVGYLPIEEYRILIQTFPTTTELNRYANYRIGLILKEYFPIAEKEEIKFNKHIVQKEKKLANSLEVQSKTLFQLNLEKEIKQFEEISTCLEKLINSEFLDETTCQKNILGIIRLIYPKYILAKPEVHIDGVDENDKRPDFLLVDANGYVDVLEIKIPGVQILSLKPSYRHNYVPVRELSGAVQQIEKYIYSLNSWGKDGEKELNKKLKSELPESVKIKILNPQGFLLLGRSKGFNKQQRNDFELIKRQYKNVADIMTYDDLLDRVNNILEALKMQVGKK